MHIAATPAEAVLPEQVDQSVLDKEKEVFVAQARESGKPDNIIEKMAGGRIQKFLKEICVSSQPFVKDPQRTVQQLQMTKQGTGSGTPIRQLCQIQLLRTFATFLSANSSQTQWETLGGAKGFGFRL